MAVDWYALPTDLRECSLSDLYLLLSCVQAEFRTRRLPGTRELSELIGILDTYCSVTLPVAPLDDAASGSQSG
jgi:hypothetical protein